MNKILKKERFSEHVFRFVVEAPEIAKARKPGNFVIIKIDDVGERIPLTIADADRQRGTINLVVQEIGRTSRKFCAMNEGDYIAHVVGPLGKPTNIKYYGNVLCACGGVGTAPMYPIAKAMKSAGNKLFMVIAARNKDLIILENEMREIADEIIIMTDDGSYGNKGLVTEGVKMIADKEKVDFCVTIGPAIMMKFVSLLTKELQIPTIASLNTIMVDGTGMCGACRVSVGGKTRFVCVDGPEFDAHQVDFNEMIMRLGAYKDIETEENAKPI